MNKLLITTLKVSLFVFSLFFITSLASSVSAQSFSCETAYSGNSARISECQVLVDFYNSTGGTNWTSKNGWLTARDYCTWHGILCSDSGSASRVITLDLNQNNLSGQLPTSLGNLANLQRLYLYKNQLSGPIPTSLGNLANLQRLYLYKNQLSGPIPTSLGNLTNLEQLLLAANQLSGPIPTSLGNLANLQNLYLHTNQLSGPIPTSLGNLTNLHELVLAANQLSGSIPASLGNLRQLTNLGLSDNNLDGAIPAELSGLIKIEDMHFETNKLSGEFPFGLASGNDVKYIYFQDQRDSQGQPPNTQICVSVRTRDVFNDIIRRGGEVLPDPAIPPICSGSNPTPTPGSVTYPSYCGCQATVIFDNSDNSGQGQCSSYSQCTNTDSRNGSIYTSRYENGKCMGSRYWCATNGVPTVGNCGCSNIVTVTDITDYSPSEEICVGRDRLMTNCILPSSNLPDMSGIKRTWRNGRCIQEIYSCTTSSQPPMSLQVYAGEYMKMMRGQAFDPRIDVNGDNAKDLRDFYRLWQMWRDQGTAHAPARAGEESGAGISPIDM